MIGSILIMVICTMANHMGLIKAIEKVCQRKLPIINCCKCSTFWFSAIYLICIGFTVINSLAISLTMAYLSLWFELILGIIDVAYDKLYSKVYGYTEAGTSTENSKDPNDKVS